MIGQHQASGAGHVPRHHRRLADDMFAELASQRAGIKSYPPPDAVPISKLTSYRRRSVDRLSAKAS
jgi:hypothetical protein